MKFHPSFPLVEATLLRREKRFLLHAQMESGEKVIAHCANTGSLMGCVVEGQRVWLSISDNLERKLKYTWELAEVGSTLVGINTQRANPLVRELIESGQAAPFVGCHLRSEVIAMPSVRMDFAIMKKEHPTGFIEVKNVTSAEKKIGYFPDAVTTRGQRHLQALMDLSTRGLRAALIFCVQRDDVRELRPADHIDAEYGKLLRKSMASGVEVYAWRASFAWAKKTGVEQKVPASEFLAKEIPVVCP